ncbi:MAG: divergent polysaccharide deacetylase family protein [Desulfobacteraceae bacterium]|nr:divergent polysaccharide deacetylase family protein [Desulfobacteraceae bacterium]
MAKRRPKIFRKTRNKQRFKGLFWGTIAAGIIAGLLFFIYFLPTPPIPRHYEHARPPLGGSTPPVTPPPVQPVPVKPSSQPVHPLAPPVKPSAGIKKVTPQPLKKAGPEVAILIDDMGYNQRLDTKLLAIDAPLSFAFLPGAPNTEKLAAKAARLGRDVLVHLPLEPLNADINPGPGALRINMTKEAILSVLKKDLGLVPDACGVNNHMGSKFTADKKAMSIVLGEIKRRGLFFVDSVTTNKSVAYALAQEMGIPSAARSVFLDDDHSPSDIKKELRHLVLLAKRNGSAIAIGHPFPDTEKVLRDELPSLRKEVLLVPVHTLTHVRR